MNRANLFILALFWCLSALAQAPLPAPPPVAGSSHILIDYHSGRVLASEDPNLQVEPASITKIMTTYVVFQELAQGRIALTDEVTISEKAWSAEGSRMFVDVNSKVPVSELLKGVVIQSGNDASIALAEYVAGSEEAFAGLMNHFAGVIGMADSHFVNATGLPDAEHYTTAHDVALLVQALIHDFPEQYELYSEKEYTYNSIRQSNRNLLLWRDPTVDGVKTGHTESAGYCLAASAQRDGMRLISAVMGTDSEKARADHTQALLNYGFRFFETVSLYQPQETLATRPVWKGTLSEVPLGVAEPWYLTMPRGRYNDLDAQMAIDQRLLAPLPEGAEVGHAVIMLDGEEIDRRPLVTLQEVPEAGFFGRTWDSVKLWVEGLGSDD
ncbi:MAG: D-alanyl-D-alanine carboxypeptidase family protein [Wenzhouxiangellaceae bacterium]